MSTAKARSLIITAAVALVASGLLLWRVVRSSLKVSPSDSHTASEVALDPGRGEATELSPASASPQGTAPNPASTAITPGQSGNAATETETELMQRLRGLVKTDPAQARRGIAEANSRFGPSEERDALDIQALSAMIQMGAARREARRYFEHYPDGRFRMQIERLTGFHPHP